MNHIPTSEWPYTPLSNPLSEMRERIEELYEQLRYGKPSRKEMLGTLQQDMRTPIGNIFACLTLLDLDDNLNSSQKELLQIIQEATDSLLMQIDEMNDLC